MYWSFVICLNYLEFRHNNWHFYLFETHSTAKTKSLMKLTESKIVHEIVQTNRLSGNRLN